MPYHTGMKKPKKLKLFSKMPPNSHKMGSIIMSGKKHTSMSKVLGRLKPKKNNPYLLNEYTNKKKHIF